MSYILHEGNRKPSSLLISDRLGATPEKKGSVSKVGASGSKFAYVRHKIDADLGALSP